MRSFILFIVLMVSAGQVLADISEKHFQELCESEESRILMGENGTCQIVVHSQTIEERGTCTGNLRSMSCEVQYVANDAGAEMLLVCGKDPTNPLIEKDMVADAYSYKVNSVIKTASGKTIIKRNDNNYQIIDGNYIQIFIKKNALQTSAAIYANLNTGMEAFTNVKCRQSFLDLGLH